MLILVSGKDLAVSERNRLSSRVRESKRERERERREEGLKVWASEVRMKSLKFYSNFNAGKGRFSPFDDTKEQERVTSLGDEFKYTWYPNHTHLNIIGRRKGVRHVNPVPVSLFLLSSLTSLHLCLALLFIEGNKIDEIECWETESRILCQVWLKYERIIHWLIDIERGRKQEQLKEMTCDWVRGLQ